MKKENILVLLSNYLIDKGLWQDFLEWAKKKGYDAFDLANPE